MKEEIRGFDAIRKIREISKSHSFTIIFYTCDRKRGEGGELRKYERCRIRNARFDELSDTDQDHYLFFTDEETGDPKMCWKKLIRFVGFPPKYKLQKVNWY